ncbi:MAG: CBS domain-containing protein [Chlamydiae bacterium]|nr:CBS domain-containing protein [Chlamydiota bacterium]MBI3276293.1 CBS domain-containing protein [Chlamydiota bacterium]
MKCSTCGHENIAGEDRCDHCLHSLMQRDLPRPKKDDRFQTVIMTAPISDLLTGKDLLVASPSDTLQKIVNIFQDEKKDCVLVYKKKKLVGILSFRDLLWKVAGKIQDLSKAKVESFMTPNPEYVRGNDPIAYVVNKMALGGFRHVPVLQEDGAPLSIISIKDVLSYLSKRDKNRS